MQLSARWCVVCLRVVCLLGAAAIGPDYAIASPAQAPVQINPGDAPMQFLPPGRQAKTGTGKLRGRVVAGDTGTIVRRAQVRISSADIGTKTAFTDAQGRYEFKDLPAGRFTLSVSKSGFVTMQYGQKRPFEPGRPIELTDGQVMDKADGSPAARRSALRQGRRRIRRGGRRRKRQRHAHAVFRRPPASRSDGPCLHDERSRTVPPFWPAAGRVLRERHTAVDGLDDLRHARFERRRTGRIQQQHGLRGDLLSRHAESG